MDKRLSTGIAIVVTTVWAISFMADIFVKGYDPSPFIHLMMMTIVGAIFGKNFLAGNGKEPNQPPQPPQPPQPQQPLPPPQPENPVV